MPETLEERIERHEGLRLKPYTDTTGNVTIGIGHNLSSLGITETQAREIFNDDLKNAELQVSTEFPWSKLLNPITIEVLIEMTFQLGIDHVKNFRKTLTHLKLEQYHDAATEMEYSVWAKQSPARVTELANLIRSCADAK